MATPQANESTVSAILKEVYPGAIEDELNNEIGVWSVLEKEKVTVQGQGQHIVRPFRLVRNPGVGARNDTDVLPLPGNQSLAAAKINMATNYLSGQITGRVMRTSYGSDAAFESALEEEIRFSLTDFVNQIGRQVYNGAGQLATVNGAVSSAKTITVSNTQYLQVGMYVEFWKSDGTNETSNDAGLATGYTGTAITAINTKSDVITVTTNQTLTSGDVIAIAGNNTSQVATKELVGLDVIIDDQTDYPSLVNYFGVSRSTYPILNGNRLSAAGSVTEDLMQQAFDLARTVGGGIIDFIATDYASRRKYLGLLTGLKRYPLEGVSAPKWTAGLEVSKDLRNQLGEGLSFSGAPVAPSRLAPPDKMWFLETSSFKVFQQSEVEWVMNGGSILHPLLVNGYDAYRFALFYDAQLYCEAPNRNAKLVSVYS